LVHPSSAIETSPVDEDAPVAPTVRLVQVLRTYCRDLHSAGLADLRTGLRDGQYPWLHEELAAAIRAGDADASWWRDVIGTPDPAEGTRRQVRAEQRRLWKELFPDQPFPG
jgi:hypothetical protein